jgi:hypothetical protein
MSSPARPSAAPTDDAPLELVVISHSPLFYWWPVWAVGFVMAGISYWSGDLVAFVPPGTRAEQKVEVQGSAGPRDILIAPAERPLPSIETGELAQPRLRMSASNSLGIVWAITFCMVAIITNVCLRGLWSVILIIVLGFTTVLLAILELWDPILRTVQGIDIHITACGYLSISLFLLVMWLFIFLVYDRQIYLIFTRGQLRVRLAIGTGESVFDTRGIVIEKHRDDLFRHWMLGFGSGDLTVRTSGTNPRYFEVPNVFRVGKKLSIISKTVKELQVVQVGA